MTVVQALIDLQEVDGRIRELEQELKDLPCRKAHEMAKLSGVSADLEAAKAKQEYELGRIKGYEDEAKALQEKIQKMKVDQLSLKTNKEYQQFSVQIDLVNHDHDAMKNNEAAARDKLPEVEALIKSTEGRYETAKGSVDAVCAELDERIAQVTEELEKAKAERAEKVKLVANPRHLLYYERLRTKRWPVVVALTRDGVCDGCHLVQPPSVSQLVDHNQDLVACTMCGRVLYRD